MKNEKLFVLPMLALGVLALCATAYAQNSDSGDGKLGPYTQVTTVTIPGGLAGFDISWVDSEAGRYYLASRGNPAAVPPTGPSIPVIDTDSNPPVLLYTIPMSNAANGIVVIHRAGNGEGEPGAGTLVAGTTPKPGETSKVFFIDLDHPSAPPIEVDTGGHKNCSPACRADELAYDPQDHIILVANDRDPDRFVTFISTENPPHVVGKIFYDGSTRGNPVSTGGIEQPVWDKRTGKFYLAIPSTKLHPDGEVDEIDPIKMKITRTFSTQSTPPCNPAGLVLIPKQRLMTSCGDVIEIGTGAIFTPLGFSGHVAGVSGDEIWFNEGDERVYFGHNPAYVVDAETYQQIIGGGAPIAAGPTHSIAADSENNRIFIPVTGAGVKVYTDDQDSGKEH
jgi:hypothetical protein